MKALRIGAGAGYAGDRIDPAAELARHGDLDVLVFECLAERTIALAQAARARDPGAGYDPLLRERMEAVLAPCVARGTVIITNMGAANPPAAAREVVAVAAAQGLTGLKVAVVHGDDVAAYVRARALALTDRPGTSRDLGDIVSANVYLGAAPLVEALRDGAQVIVTGRVGDPALFLAPMMHAFDWRPDDWTRLGQGTVVGHLLECAGQLAGGYFADPGVKDVAGLARLGFPIAEIYADGTALLTKVAGSGGRIDARTCTEQLLYEILDPAAYPQADVVTDITGVQFREDGPDRVIVSGGRGRAAPDKLKVSIGYRDGFIGEGQMSYAGPGCTERGELAIAVIKERIEMLKLKVTELRCDIIGAGARDIRIRVAARSADLRSAQRVGEEVEALYTNGPAGGGGAYKSAREVIAIASALVPRAAVVTRLEWLVS